MLMLHKIEKLKSMEQSTTDTTIKILLDIFISPHRISRNLKDLKSYSKLPDNVERKALQSDIQGCQIVIYKNPAPWPKKSQNAIDFLKKS